MDDFTYKSSPHNLERSLLQKAVRRGDVGLVEKVISYLIGVGDRNWLKKRLIIIAYEECWPLATEINSDKIYDSYKKLALSVKIKTQQACQPWQLGIIAPKKQLLP